MLVIPLPGLGRNTYIDENALQPSQVQLREPWSVLFHVNNICALRSIPIGTGATFMLQTPTLLNWKEYVTLISRVNSQHSIAWSLHFFKFVFQTSPVN